MARSAAGIQAQDPYAARLSFRSRSRSLTAAEVDRARTEERSLLRTWLMRITIHLIPTEDAGWMLPLFEPRIEKWSRRRLGQLGMPSRTQERAQRLIARTLEREGPLGRTEIAERLLGGGIGPLDTQLRGHVIGLAVASGIACLGPDGKGGTRLVRREDWLGKLPRFDGERALAELSRRYLRAFGPASDRDFAHWAGLGLREVRAGLAAISGEIEEVRVGEQTLLSLRGGAPLLPRPGQLRMLGNFDTYLLGWKDRSFSVPDEYATAVKEGGGGWIRPVIVRDGIVVGSWRASRRGGAIEIRLGVPRSLPPGAWGAIEAEIRDIERFEGMPVKLTSAQRGTMPRR